MSAFAASDPAVRAPTSPARTAVVAAVASVTAVALGLGLGCSPKKPEASGTQRLETTGAREQMKLLLSGPEGVVGGVTPSEPAYFQVRLSVQGPADGMSIVRVANPNPSGCNLTGQLPAYLALGENGAASLDAWVTFWAAKECSFEVEAESGTQYSGEYRDQDTGEFRTYRLSGAVDSTRLNVTFANLDPS